MKTFLPLVLLFTGAAGAATLVQTQNYTIAESYTGVTGPTVVVTGDYLTASLDPFSAALGTLESITITWTLAGNFSGTIAAPGGGVSAGYNGNFLVQSLTYPTSPNGSGAGGGGNGSGGPGGMMVSAPLTAPGNPLSFTRTFFVADAGSDYDAGILAAFTGGSPVLLEWDTPLTIEGNWDDLDVSGSGSVEMVYTYAAVPEPSVALFGVIALGLAGLKRRRR
jgi:MYXO-CTERM domain-containing protein